MNRALLLSIRGTLADLIFDGTKSVELRRRRPAVHPGDYLIVYVPSPLKRIAGVVAVRRVVEAPISSLWRRVRGKCGISHREFLAYFAGLDVGFGIELERPARLACPVLLNELQILRPGFSPQGYRYLSRNELADALVRLNRRRSDVQSGRAHGGRTVEC